MITIVDYGVGNVRAFLNVFKQLNVEAGTATTPESITAAERLILPGVGDFDEAMQRLNASGMRPALEAAALHRRIPVLGVCVGLQMLARSSEEGSLPGLGWVAADVKAFRSTPEGREIPVPHMGWNDVRPAQANPLFDGLTEESRFYFLHSYYFECDRDHDVAATTGYGFDFCSAVTAGNIFGVQFHPEKSHSWGTRLLRNFGRV